MSFASNMQIAWVLIKILVPIILVLFVLLIFLKFRYILIIRHRAPDGYIQWTEFGLAQKKEDKETKTPRLQRLLKKKDYIPLPQASSIVPIKGGRFIIEFAYTQDGTYQPIRAPSLDSLDDDNVKTAFDPVSRAELVLHEKARLQQMQTWKQLVFPITCMFIMAILIVSGMIFYGQVAQPLIMQANANANVALVQGETAQKMDAMVQQMNRMLVNLQKVENGEKAIFPPQVLREEGP